MRYARSVDAVVPRVLVIPGLDGNPGLWRSVAEIALPGLRPLWFDHSMDRAADGLLGLARRALKVLETDADGTAPAYICGESFGGPIALTLARHFPDRVRGLILISTFGRYPARLNIQLGLAATRLLGNHVTRRLLEVTHPLTAAGALGDRAPEHIAQAYVRRALGDVGAYRTKCELTLRFDARPWLHEIRSRAVVLAADADRVVPPAAGRRLAQGLRLARFHALAGGHLAWCVRPAEVGSLVDAWLPVT